MRARRPRAIAKGYKSMNPTPPVRAIHALSVRDVDTSGDDLLRSRSAAVAQALGMKSGGEIFRDDEEDSQPARKAGIKATTIVVVVLGPTGKP